MIRKRGMEKCRMIVEEKEGKEDRDGKELKKKEGKKRIERNVEGC